MRDIAVGNENCERCSSWILAWTVRTKVSWKADIILATDKTFVLTVHASIREKSSLQFLLPTARKTLSSLNRTRARPVMQLFVSIMIKCFIISVCSGHWPHVQIRIRDSHESAWNVQARPGKHEVHQKRGPRTVQLRSGKHPISRSL